MRFLFNKFPLLSKVVIALSIIFLLFVFLSNSSFANLLKGKTIVNVEKSSIDFGKLVQGKKISIRDNIEFTDHYSYFIDGKYFTFGNEEKTGIIKYYAEVGYKIDDIKKSEKIDSLNFWNKSIKRILLVHLPLPQTINFVVKERKEKAKGGWKFLIQNYEFLANTNSKTRKAIYDSLHIISQNRFRNELLKNLDLRLEEAALTLHNHINGAYRLATEKGFDEIISAFEFRYGDADYKVKISCNEKGCRTVERLVVRQNNIY